MTRLLSNVLTTVKRGRFVIVGMAEERVLLLVAYAERGERIRLISAHRATPYEQDDYCRQNA